MIVNATSSAILWLCQQDQVFWSPVIKLIKIFYYKGLPAHQHLMYFLVLQELKAQIVTTPNGD